MSVELDEEYLLWLYSQVASVHIRSKTKSYWSMFRLLHSKEFTWFVPNDDNRVEDGLDIRAEFLGESTYLPEAHSDWMSLGCSMLEMLIGLSRRLSFEAEGEPRDWFWHLIHNLSLTRYTDSYSDLEGDRFDFEVSHILDRVIDRTYDANGHGGLFPLTCPEEDQTRVELWYQLCSYLLERE